jgi:hypothetical protein
VKKQLLFLVRLIVISLLFMPALPLFQKTYKFVLVFLTTGSIPTDEMTKTLPYDGSSNLYIFIVLILAISGMETRKRMLGLFTGVALFLLSDFLMTTVWIHYLKAPRPSLTNMAVSYGWLVMTHYLLPFLLWFAFAFRQIEGLCRGVPAIE